MGNAQGIAAHQGQVIGGAVEIKAQPIQHEIIVKAGGKGDGCVERRDEIEQGRGVLQGDRIVAIDQWLPHQRGDWTFPRRHDGGGRQLIVHLLLNGHFNADAVQEFRRDIIEKSFDNRQSFGRGDRVFKGRVGRLPALTGIQAILHPEVILGFGH